MLKVKCLVLLATTTAFNDVTNNIPDVDNLVKKSDYDTKSGEIENKIDHDRDNKYVTAQEFNTLTAENFATRLKQANLVIDFVKKTDFYDKLKKSYKKITSNKTKHVLVENEFKKLETYDSSLFVG